MQIVDLACFVGQPCKDSAIEFIDGIYPRNGVPKPIAVVGGLLIPYVLICVSGFLAFRRTSGITRISIVCGLALTAAVLLAPLGIISYLAASTGDEIDRLIIPGGIPNVVALSISGLTAAIGGIWLFATRANHTRSGIDRRHLPPARA